jgi:hypothetical protein
MWNAWVRRGMCKRFWWETEKKKGSLGRPSRRWEDGIRMDLREIGLGSVEWIQLAQDRYRWRALVNTLMNLRVLALRTKFKNNILLNSVTKKQIKIKIIT